MINSDGEWLKRPGAKASAIHELRQALSVELPDAYFDFLSFSNGGEGPLPCPPFNCCLDAVEAVTRNWREKMFEEFFPGFVVIGGNGAGELIAFDIRDREPWGVVAIDMTNIDLDESVLPVAAGFDEFRAMLGISKSDG
jgi:hypothetical protein